MINVSRFLVFSKMENSNIANLKLVMPTCISKNVKMILKSLKPDHTYRHRQNKYISGLNTKPKTYQNRNKVQGKYGKLV